MTTRIERRKYTCPFRDNGCGGENCRCWDEYHQTCGLVYDGVMLEQLSDNVAYVGNQLDKLVKLFREIVVFADDDPTERVRDIR